MHLFKSKTQIDTSSDAKHSQEDHPFIEILRFSIIAILIVVPVRMFIAQPFIVSGASMQETFQDGEYLIVDQVTYLFEEPQRGDVVIFRYPKDPSKFFIKRVIAVPGETITIEDTDVTITSEAHPDGIILDEPYIKSMQPVRRPIVELLGDREYFVMGDNRDESSDSRSWGVLLEDRIVGRAFLRLFPPQEIDYLPGAVEVEVTDVTSS